MNRIELLATALTILSVWLSTREKIASWPTALVGVSLYFAVFLQARLYAAMGLQVFYFSFSCYGWYQWKFGGSNRSELHVGRATRRQAIWLIPLGVLGAGALGLVLARTTDAALPWVDAAVASTSLVAQWMMTRKLLENWLIWIAVNLVSIPMYLSQGLYPTAALYGVLLVLAAQGYVQWRRSYLSTASPLVTVPASA